MLYLQYCISVHSSLGQKVLGPRGAVEGSMSVPRVSWRQEPGPRSRGVRHTSQGFNVPILRWILPARDGRLARLPLARLAGEMASVIPEPLIACAF